MFIEIQLEREREFNISMALNAKAGQNTLMNEHMRNWHGPDLTHPYFGCIPIDAQQSLQPVLSHRKASPQTASFFPYIVLALSRPKWFGKSPE